MMKDIPWTAREGVDEVVLAWPWPVDCNKGGEQVVLGCEIDPFPPGGPVSSKISGG